MRHRQQTHSKDGEPSRRDAFHSRETKLGPEHPHTVESLNELVTLYESWPKPDEAAKWRSKLARRDDSEQ